MIVQNRIEGTRITVWDVLHYLTAGWSCPDIAAPLHLTEAQVAAAARCPFHKSYASIFGTRQGVK